MEVLGATAATLQHSFPRTFLEKERAGEEVSLDSRAHPPQLGNQLSARPGKLER
jgi:hypothetical protein